MQAEKNLEKTIASLNVLCDNKKYVFSTRKDLGGVDLESIIGIFKEAEGYTLIAEEVYIQKIGGDWDGVFARLTIDIHTSLEMVGLTAYIADILTKKGISANVVAAYYHDHVFVPFESRGIAMKELERGSLKD